MAESIITNNLTINGQGNHRVDINNANGFVSLQIQTDANNFTNLVFYDTGKITIEGKKNGSWVADVVLRNAF